VADKIRGTYGTLAEKVYDDWENINEVTSLPDEAWHRNVDKIVLAAGNSKDNVHTAIVCPPTIYGSGRGPGNTYSDQWYLMAKAVIQRGKPFQIGEGKNIWTQIHVYDLSNLYLHLVEAAAAGGGNATWNDKGYYFAENGEFEWGAMARKIGEEAYKQGFVKSPEVDSVSIEEGNELTPVGGWKWGFNSRCRAIRGRKLFGWEPAGESIESLLPSLVRDEAMKLGVVKGHAAQAGGNA
jgi:nucleoside-diphosphate-sugar epimerase